MRQDSRRATLIGLGFVLVTAFGWGLNWPATKFLLSDCPPLSARGVSGVVASLGLAALALFRGESLAVPRALWWRLVRSGLLNVSAWMGLTTLSLVWLTAGEAVTLAYTMPIWAALLAWPVLGERPGWRKLAALALGIGGIIILVGGNGFTADIAKLPGIVSALTASVLFGLGTVLSKRAPVALPPTSLTAWQVGIGCIPLLAVGLLFEHPHFTQLPAIGWAALAYTAAISLGLCYLTWFAALRRLKAGTAAIATLLTPVIGVGASALALGEPLLWPQLTALALILCAIIRSVHGDGPKPLDQSGQTSTALAEGRR